jgi:carbamoyltransferase
MNNILGISCYYHDSAAAIVQKGNIVAAAQEERFSRIKHDESFPSKAVEFCLKEAGLEMNQIDAVVFYDKPFLKFERILETYLTVAPSGFLSFIKAMPVWVKDKLWTKGNIKKSLDYEGPLYFTEHHMSHAASAFFPSPFEEAVIITADGVGEWATTSIVLSRRAKRQRKSGLCLMLWWEDFQPF